jgi:signal transduction histidine kinase
MFQGLKIAVKRQKKLLVIFLITIFIPAVTLSIFGVIALRNQKFRLEKQFREEQAEFVQLLKMEVNQQIHELENELQYIVRTPSFINNDYGEIVQIVENQLDRNKLIDQFFILFEGEDPLFPPFRPSDGNYISRQPVDFTGIQKSILSQAEYYEFSYHNYREAISLLEEILSGTENKDLRARLMNRIARNQVKQNNYSKALETYNTIINDFPESVTSSGIPLPVTIRLQLVDCYMQTGQDSEALKETLNAFEEILNQYYNLSETRFKAYISMVRDKFNNLMKDIRETEYPDPAYADEFESLNTRYDKLITKWQVINTLKNEVIPRLSRELIQNTDNAEDILRYSERIGSDDFLILSMIIPGESRIKQKGIAGIKIYNKLLEDSLLPGMIINTGNENTIMVISDQGGRIIEGDSAYYNKTTNIISYFDGNFPPWRIEVPGEPTRTLAFSGFTKSFYFWSILTMMIILVFGIVIINRSIAHEKEILQIKSDFVSSVSHEFKTPITSIKALAERLLEGTVKNQKRMQEYYSVIFRDAENLGRLVGNILDFSKMEESKKEYNPEETDFKVWLEHTVKDYKDKTLRRIIFNSLVIEQSVKIKIDRAAMKLAVDNLLDNAVKFSSDSSEIKVILEKKGNDLVISIKDSGIGIPPDDQEKIFEKFYRSKSSAAYSATGTGLGLTIVKKVVEAHGGRIDVESEVGKGSTFTVSIPLGGN